MPVLRDEDVRYLLKNTNYKEAEIREWFREFIMVGFCALYLVSCVLNLVFSILYPDLVKYILYPYTVSCILNPVFSILFLVSCILYPVSWIQYLVSWSCILYLVSFIQNPVFSILILYPVSCILYPKSSI